MSVDNLHNRPDVPPLVESTNISPDVEFFTEDGYRFFAYPPELTGLRLVCAEDTATGMIVTTAIANPEKRTAAHKAWAGARHSRAPGMPWEIMHEMGEKGVDPDARLETTFTTFGHKSVGDMARISVDLVDVPMHLCLSVFNEGIVNSGQEKSSRYQRQFEGVALHLAAYYLPDLSKEEMTFFEAEYQRIGQEAQQKFGEWVQRIESVYTQHFGPENSREISSLGSRALDTARSLLLAGNYTGMTFETSARDWSRLIGEFRASPTPVHNRLANLVQRLLAPSGEEEMLLKAKSEAPSLIRHTEAITQPNQNLASLKEFLVGSDMFGEVKVNPAFKGLREQGVSMIPKECTVGDKMVAHYILTLFPGLEPEDLLSWIHSRPREVKAEISRIIMKGHDNITELPNMAATRELSVIITGSLGEQRDLNRHRAQTRFINLPTVYGDGLTASMFRQIFNQGFVLPLYLTEIEEFASLSKGFQADLNWHYEQVSNLLDKTEQKYGDSIKYDVFLNLLPLAHCVDLWMHGDPKQMLYMPHQRVKPGGHINYRDLAYQISQLVADSDDYLSAMAVHQRPDPADRAQFFDRS